MASNLSKTDRKLRSDTRHLQVLLFIEIMCHTDLLSLIRQHLNLREIVALGSCYRVLYNYKCHHLFIDLLGHIWVESLQISAGFVKHKLIQYNPLQIVMSCIKTFPTETRLIIEWAAKVGHFKIQQCLDSMFICQFMSRSELEWMERFVKLSVNWKKCRFRAAIQIGDLKMAQWVYKDFFINEEQVGMAYQLGHFHILLWLIEHTSVDNSDTVLAVLRGKEEQLSEDSILLGDLLKEEYEKVEKYMEKLDRSEQKRVEQYETLNKNATTKKWTKRQRIEIIKEGINGGSKLQDFNKQILSDIISLSTETVNLFKHKKNLERMSRAFTALPKLIEIIKNA